MRSTFPVRCAAVAVLALVPAVAWAEDPAPTAPPPPAAPAPAAPAPAASPVEAAKKVRAAFPEPSEKGAFTVTLDIMMSGQKQGEVTFTVAADAGGTAGKVWRTKTDLLAGPPEAPQVRRKTAVTLERDLRLMHEERNDVEGAKKTTTMIVRTAKGFDVSVTEGDTAPVKTEIAAPADATTAELAALLLFLRMSPADAAKYEVEAYSNEQKKLTKKSVDVKGVGRMKEAGLGLDLEAWVAVVTDGKDVREVFLDPKDRALLGMHSVDRGFWVVKQGLAKAKDVGPVPDFKAGAKSAKDVGINFAMGILVGDIDVIIAQFHIPSMVKDVKEQMGMDLDEEAFKGVLTQMLTPSLKDMKPELAWPLVKGAADGSTEEAGEDGAVKVTMGAPFQQVTYVTKQFDGKWLVTKMEQPK